MQLTQALSLVPQRQEPRYDAESNERYALLPLEDVQRLVTAPQRDAPLLQFALPRLLDFFNKRGKEKEEVSYAMRGVLNELLYEEAVEEEMQRLRKSNSLLKWVATWAVKKVGRFIRNTIFRFIWRVTKWAIKKIVMGGIRLMLRWLIVPAMEALMGFLATPVGLALAIIGGAAAAGYLMYKLWFDKEPDSNKPSSLEEARALATGAAAPFAAGSVGAFGTPVSVGPYEGVASTDLAALLTKGESRAPNPYIVVNKPNANHGRGAAGTAPLEEMTVSQVMAAQAAGQFNAAGRYQIIDTTLRGAFNALHLTGNELFDRNMQDRIFNEYLTGPKKRPRLYAYLSGKSNDVYGAAADAAQEWASVAMPIGFKLRSGAQADGLKSYYDNSKNNRASITAADMIATLQQERARREGVGVTQTDVTQVVMKPGSAIPATVQNRDKQQAAASYSMGLEPPSPDRTIIQDKRGRPVSVAM